MDDATKLTVLFRSVPSCTSHSPVNLKNAVSANFTVCNPACSDGYFVWDYQNLWSTHAVWIPSYIRLQRRWSRMESSLSIVHFLHYWNLVELLAVLMKRMMSHLPRDVLLGCVAHLETRTTPCNLVQDALSESLHILTKRLAFLELLGDN